MSNRDDGATAEPSVSVNSEALRATSWHHLSSKFFLSQLEATDQGTV